MNLFKSHRFLQRVQFDAMQLNYLNLPNTVLICHLRLIESAMLKY